MHNLGYAWTNSRRGYVPIPKCASTSIKDGLLDIGWKEAWFTNTPCPVPVFTVVRHPVERWFSGATEHAARTGRSYRDLVDTVLAGGHPVFDEHTQKQSDFLLSTFHSVELVPIDQADLYVAGLGAVIGHRNRRRWQTDPRLTRTLETFYSEDMELYALADRNRPSRL